MSTQRYLAGDLSRKGSSNQASYARWDLSIHFGIQADRQSLFYALTMPEYIETWLRAPGYDCVLARNDGPTYSLHFRGREMPEFEVQGSWLICRPDDLALTWNRRDAMMRVASTIRIQLSRSAGGSMVHLSHRGFTAREQSLWHGQLWHASLENLAELLEFAHSAEDRPTARICATSFLHRNPALKRRPRSRKPPAKV